MFSFISESADKSIFFAASSDNTRLAVEAFGIIVIVFVVFVGIIYLRNLFQITDLDVKAKNAGGHIDTLIWDMNFNKGKIINIFEEAGIKIPAEVKKEPMLSLGMSPATQLYNYNLMKEAETALLSIADENESLKDEKLIGLLDKYKEIHAELGIASEKYNAAAKSFNSYISHFPASFIADKKNKKKRNPFVYTD